MRIFSVLGLAFCAVLGFLCLFHGHAQAQSVERICIPSYDTASGAMSCQDVTSANPFPTSAGVAPDGTPVTGNITSNQCVTLTTTGGYGTFGYNIAGTWTGTIIVQGSVDGTTWYSTTAVPLTMPAVSSFTANSAGQGNLAGLTGVRFCGSTVATGTAAVTIRPNVGVATIMQDNPNWSVLLPPSNINGSGAVTHSAVTTAYAANQLFANNTTGNAVPTQITVTGLAGGTGFITKAEVEDSGTGASAPPGYTVYLFSGLPTTTGLVDYSTYIGPYAADITAGNYLGSLTCASFVKTNDATAQWHSGCTTSNTIVGPLPYKATLGFAVYALVAVNGSYTPISGETLTFKLSTTRDQ